MTDPALAARLVELAPAGARRLAAAVVDLRDDPVVRIARLHHEVVDGDWFEIGSVTKGLTGLLLADAVERGDVSLLSPIRELVRLPDWSPVGDVTLRELCTHTSGLPRLPHALGTAWRAAASGWFGRDPYRGVTATQVVASAGRQRLEDRGRYRYSNLGGALVGQVLASVTVRPYPVLLRERLLDLLVMTSSHVGERDATAPPGRSASGRRRGPWIMDGYAPAGGAVSTIEDMARLARALVDGSVPGATALTPIDGVATDRPGRATGMFWLIDPAPDGATLTWHNGATGGYSSFLGLEQDRAIVVLADGARVADQERVALALLRAR